MLCTFFTIHFSLSLQKKKGKVKVKFVPQRGFAITTEKVLQPKLLVTFHNVDGMCHCNVFFHAQQAEDEPKGAHGYTPRKSSKV